MTHYAHTLDGKPEAEWEPLAVHLDEVAETAGGFAAAFDAGAWGRLLGALHDVGKYSEEFQTYLRAATGADPHAAEVKGRVDHATAGAQHAATALPAPIGRMLAYLLAGHHAGLADWRTTEDTPGGRSSLADRLEKQVPDWSAAPADRLAADAPPWPSKLLEAMGRDAAAKDAARTAFRLAFFGRMLFSALCDADFLRTEGFMSPDRAADRTGGGPDIIDFAAVLDRHLDTLTAGAKPTAVNTRRREVLDACRAKAGLAPGFFSLSVPTGGGKTLASLAFALRHAGTHGLRRAVVAIPFTSVIEQTADVYRDVFTRFGPDAVLEHHSARDPDAETTAARLASENWDARLVVTTNVQLFESLFADRTSRCRKLHRLAGSVIVLDEAQTLPVDLLAPCLAALRELVEVYGSSVVLCTATQPALDRRDEFPIGLEDVREIIPEPRELYTAMRRVRVEYAGDLPDPTLAARLAEKGQVLCVVNSRPHAAAVYVAVREELGLEGDAATDAAGLIHLSTNLCAVHRSERFAEIRRRLADGEPCRVVSTQLIEAGVDVDFPAVFRALCGLDSAAQAAGRCNREGRLGEGVLTLFVPEKSAPPGLLRSAADTTAELFALGEYDDLLDPDAVRRFFELHLWKQPGPFGNWDRRVLECFHTPQTAILDYATAADRFRMIADDATPVLVPWREEGETLIARLRRVKYDGTPVPPDRATVRRLRRYAVGVHDRNVLALRAAGDLGDLHDGRFTVLARPDLYDPRLGLRVDRPGWYEPGTLVV